MATHHPDERAVSAEVLGEGNAVIVEPLDDLLGRDPSGTAGGDGRFATDLLVDGVGEASLEPGIEIGRAVEPLGCGVVRQLADIAVESADEFSDVGAP
ncbi:MAG: hypothetical protein R2710_16130 [Acidimicrobiales bacterium]